MTFVRVTLAAAALAAAFSATAQPPSARDLYKGKVREGLYEVRNDSDLTGAPGIPKEAMKGSETRQRCLTKEAVERGIEPGKDCRTRSYRPAEGSAHVVMECKDGTVTDSKFSFSPAGFASETRITGTQEGKPFVSMFRSQARYLGPCPPTGQAPAPAPAKK